MENFWILLGGLLAFLAYVFFCWLVIAVLKYVTEGEDDND